MLEAVPYPAWHQPNMVICVCKTSTWEIQFKVILGYGYIVNFLTAWIHGTLNQN